MKNPILWISQAEALTQAAVTIIKSEPGFENMPIQFRGICDSQFCAIGLMLVGYSLEVALKAMMVIKYGTDGYNRHSAPDLGINLPIALTQYLQNDLL
ncbi:hypothetical protein ACK355_16020, partial [Aeromonas veronii]